MTFASDTTDKDVPVKKLRIIMAGGGTGGHLFPAVAMAQAFQDMNSKNEVLFVNTGKEFEKTVLAEHGFRLACISAEGIKGRGLKHQLRALIRLPVGVAESFRILAEFRPDIVVGVGSYASGPLILAAWICRIPIVLHEQNILPGITNRVLFPLAAHVHVSFPDTRLGRKSSKIRVSGNPVRKDIREWTAQADSAEGMSASENRPFTICIIGGSQGAHAINLAVMDALPLLKMNGYHFIHQTGVADLQMVQGTYRRNGVSGVVQPFFRDMTWCYSQADLMICRSGATTVAELTAIGKPAILIPFPYASDNHQEWNARSLLQSQAAEMIRESDLTGVKLAGRIRHFAQHPEILTKMVLSARKLGNPHAAQAIARDCYDLVQETHRHE
jgi:UDP-N-acetylglucosamine--N-acetylmuramyl-(pentapeptide) pyrophosphoryl-undecaprenol N-acetylglucosamine transferase